MPKRRKHATDEHRYPPINDYALIGDCHSAALVSRTGSIDWCCMPRIDAGSSFARILDWEHGGHWSIDATDEVRLSRSYVGNTMVLETHYATASGEARVIDCFATRPGGATDPHRQLLRVVEGVRGVVAMRTEMRIRFDYGDIKPWLRFHKPGLWSATGGDDAVVINSDVELEIIDTHDFRGEWTVRAGDRVH
ncbi:MAG: trehalase-like domain-containing protein, partial [Acidimicrobiales bacterium]